MAGCKIQGTNTYPVASSYSLRVANVNASSTTPFNDTNGDDPNSPTDVLLGQSYTGLLFKRPIEVYNEGVKDVKPEEFQDIKDKSLNPHTALLLQRQNRL
jgi:hypothetical protein